MLDNSGFRSQLETYQIQIEKQIEAFFKSELRNIKHLPKIVLLAVKTARDFSMRKSKRIRPILFKIGYDCIKDCTELDELTKASLSIEFVHNWFLMHDDFIDKDELRRGQKTAHKFFADSMNAKFSSEIRHHYGVTMAVLTGNLFSAYANQLLAQSKFPKVNKLECIDKLGTIVLETHYGQFLDIETTHLESKDVRYEDVSMIDIYKTAKYTIEGPLHLGAILAGAAKRQLSDLTKYSIPLGKAFQIHDDILGLFGTERKIGKPVDSDIKEGKKTMLVKFAMDQIGSTEKRFIERCLGNTNLSDSDVIKFRRVITDSGSLDHAKKYAEKQAEEAKKVIQKSDFNKTSKAFLLDLADYIVKREN